MKILGMDYRISIMDHNESSDLGRINHGTNAILLRDDLSHTCMEQTVLHEALHAIDFHLSTEMDEKDVNRIATGFYQVLKDAGVDLSPLLRGITHE